jgi:hypothetical protein
VGGPIPHYTYIYKKARDFSDHNPLILTSQHIPLNVSREFRFELSWLKHPEFKQKVGELWSAPTRDVVTSDKVLFKMKK